MEVKIIQDPLTDLGAGFGSALADIFPAESLHISAERLSDGVFPHLIKKSVTIWSRCFWTVAQTVHFLSLPAVWGRLAVFKTVAYSTYMAKSGWQVLHQTPSLM